MNALPQVLTTPRPSRGRAVATRRRVWMAIAACAFVCLYVFPYFPKLNNPNENVRFYMTTGLVEHGTYQIDAARQKWGWVNDAATRDGHYYSVKGPGTSLLGVPGYALYYFASGKNIDRTHAMWVVRITATVIPILVFLFFFYKWLGRFTTRRLLSDCVFFAFALGSPFLAYSYLYVSHSMAGACGFGAFMILYDARRNGSQNTGPGGTRTRALLAFLAGLLAAGATMFEYPGLIFTLALTVYALLIARPWRLGARSQAAWVRLGAHLRAAWVVPFFLGALIPALFVMHFQWKAFGSPFTPGHQMLENPEFRFHHNEGLFGVHEFHWEAARKLLFDGALGLFPLSPIFLFAIPGLAILIKSKETRLDGIVAAAGPIGTYIAICSLDAWQGGWSVGPRYLTWSLPFLAWPSVVALDWIADRSERAALVSAFGCTIASWLVCGITSMYYPHLPPEIEHPIPELIQILIRHDYAPSNAANLIGIYGTISMLPIALLVILLIAAGLREIRPPSERGLVLAGALAMAAGIVIPQCFANPTLPARKALAFVTSVWTPEGHDRASRMRDALIADPTDTEKLRALAKVYEDESRTDDAKRILARTPR